MELILFILLKDWNNETATLKIKSRRLPKSSFPKIFETVIFSNRDRSWD
jgi:hypothetical protein